LPSDEYELARGIFFEHFRLKPGKPEFELLRGIVSCYSSLPYENVTKIIKKFTVTDPMERLRKPKEVVTGFVEMGTGGTCFSLTYALGSILSKTGFTCYPVMADMKRPNIHCALVVELNSSRFLVDPGYLLGEPLELTGASVKRETPLGTIELRKRGEEVYDLYTIVEGERKWRYRVRTRPVSKALFLRYWQESFDLPMMNNLLLTRLTGEGHLYVKNHHLRIRSGSKKVNENIRRELEERISREFGIPAELVSEAKSYLERLKESWRIQKQARRRSLSL